MDTALMLYYPGDLVSSVTFYHEVKRLITKNKRFNFSTWVSKLQSGVQG